MDVTVCVKVGKRWMNEDDERDSGSGGRNRHTTMDPCQLPNFLLETTEEGRHHSDHDAHSEPMPM